MAPINDPSIVFIKAAQYLVNQKLQKLRTAMYLQRMNIAHTIFEANDAPGGRVFTYHFPSDPVKSPPGKHDYYEVGATSFPENIANKPTFDLFEELGLTFRGPTNPAGQLIPFLEQSKQNIHHYNNVTKTTNDLEFPSQLNFDLFNESIPSGNVPRDFLDQQDFDREGNPYRGLEACYFKAFNDTREKILDNFDEEWPKFLNEWDWASTRSYLAQARELKFPQTVIDWIEKHKSGTGRYSRSVAEELLDSTTFNHSKSAKFDWWCIDGGSEILIKKMVAALLTEPLYNHRVTAVKEEPTTDPGKRMRVSVQGHPDQFFSHVVSTVTFPVLRTIKTAGVQMNFSQREAMRALNYGHSVKVGIKFKTRWWERPDIVAIPQSGGASRTDRQVRVVVYPSYGIGEDGPGVLTVSYNWDQDAARFGALINLNTEPRSEAWPLDRPITPTEQLLLDQIYEDLAVMHAPADADEAAIEALKARLIQEALGFHAYDWYGNPYTMGAFAEFTPGQFTTVFADILQPAGKYGNFHFAGEVTSYHHTWLAGALDSAARVARHIGMDLVDHGGNVGHRTKRTDVAQDNVPQSLVFADEESPKIWWVWGLIKEEY